MKNKKSIARMGVDWTEFDPFKAFTTMVREPLFEYPKRFRELLNEGYEIPKVDIIDKGSAFHVKVDLPAVDKKDVKVKVTENTITIKAEKEEEKEESGSDFYAKERSSMGFYRVIELPEPVNSKTTKARMDNGTLNIEVQKAKEENSSEVKVE
ncbi:MAG: Hsp20/alpha crystallin family protein [Candidatus Micrarchaeia archaeon]